MLEATFLGKEKWIPSHHTLEDARARLEYLVDEYEMRDASEAESRCELRSEIVIASAQDGDMVTWFIRSMSP